MSLYTFILKYKRGEKRRRGKGREREDKRRENGRGGEERIGEDRQEKDLISTSLFVACRLVINGILNRNVEEQDACLSILLLFSSYNCSK